MKAELVIFQFHAFVVNLIIVAFVIITDKHPYLPGHPCAHWYALLIALQKGRAVNR